MDMEFVLDQMEIDPQPFALCELYGKCDLGLGKDPSAVLHYVLAGEGELVLPGRRPIPITGGTLALVPALQNHRLRSFGGTADPIPACRPAGLNLLHLEHGHRAAGAGGLVALCTHLDIGLRRTHNLIDLVRAPMIERVGEGDCMARPMRDMVAEISAPQLGSRALVRALLLQCVIELMRRRMSARDGGLQWLAALRDPKLWPVLKAMLDAPGEAHSVESLAILSGMSRSAFAKRFSEAYGRGPMELLRDLRMRSASALLAETDQPVKRIAELVGFRSRSAFSRTFEAQIGVSPQAYRTERLQLAAAARRPLGFPEGGRGNG